jgi:hypothetical protein
VIGISHNTWADIMDGLHVSQAPARCVLRELDSPIINGTKINLKRGSRPYSKGTVVSAPSPSEAEGVAY